MIYYTTEITVVMVAVIRQVTDLFFFYRPSLIGSVNFYDFFSTINFYVSYKQSKIVILLFVFFLHTFPHVNTCSSS